LCFPNPSHAIDHKLSPRSTRCVLLGYPQEHKGYCCFDLTTRKIIISRQVVFDETSFPYTDGTTSSAPSPSADNPTIPPDPTAIFLDPRVQ
jgi:hypothetical protein